MQRYRVTVSYDGTHYFGFQRQSHQPSIQGKLEEALRRLGWSGDAVLPAARTDRGVHATGQVIAFDLDWLHTNEELVAAMNAHLPADIAVKQAEPCAADFVPRYAAASRTYRYHLVHQSTREPLRERYAWRVWPPLDLEAANQASAYALGKHDFRAFGRPTREGGSTTRTIFAVNWGEEEGGCAFEVSADAFLTHMVRCMVYQIVHMGRDGSAWESWRAALDEGAPVRPGLAPANGLVLERVAFHDSSSYS